VEGQEAGFCAKSGAGMCFQVSGNLLACFFVEFDACCISSAMPAPNSDESKRKYWPPPIWTSKKKQQQQQGPPPADPPIVKHVKLPETVTARYLAEITGQELPRMVEELKRLRLWLGFNRSIGFEAAAQLLRKHGIAAEREGD
jgi:hypothetical protein